MRDRTLGIILTVLLVFLIGIPGLAFLCLGLSSFLFYPVLNSNVGISPVWINTFGVFGLCIGFILVLITILVSYLLLHRRPDLEPIKPVAPIQPVMQEKPTPPSNPDEPLPPPI